jgi:hypothetical protein
MVQDKQGKRDKRARLTRFRWVIGTPYFVEGTSILTEVPILYFIKFTLGWEMPEGRFLMSLSNATNMFEGVVGAGLYDLFKQPAFNWLTGAFKDSFLNVAHTTDERTLILQMFIYISLFLTLLTIPFVEILRRELARQKIDINLGKRN